MGTLRGFLHSHPNLNYLQRCLRNINNKSFVNSVLNLYSEDADTVKFTTLGELNKNKNIFLYERYDNMPGGFFAILKGVLHSLYFAERFGFVPVINFSKDWFYAENEEINGTLNPWEYYFEPVSDVTVEDAHLSFNVVLYENRYQQLANSLNDTKHRYLLSENYIQKMGEIYRKWIHLNVYTKSLVERDISNLINKKTIGVHVRGTDFKKAFNEHPVFVSFEEYLEYTYKIVTEGTFEQVFLATDDLEALDIFKKKFKDKLVYFDDVERGSGSDVNFIKVSNRLNHKYLLGLEVIRDVYTLVACDGLIAGISNVGAFARIIKSAENDKYEYLKIINKGINTNNNNCENYVKKLSKKINIK